MPEKNSSGNIGQGASPTVQRIDPRGRLSLGRMRDSSFAHLLLTPVYMVLVVGLGFPFVYSIYLSLQDLQLTRLSSSSFVGLGNYISILTSAAFKQALPATVVFVGGSTALSMVIGIGLALLLSQPLRHGGSFYRVVLLVPWAVPPVVVAWMWLWIVNPNFGVLNAVLKALGLIRVYQNWLGHPVTANICVITAQAWKAVPFLTFLLLARLLDIPKNLYRAAKIDGADAWQRFRFVTLPSWRDTLLVALVLETMWNLLAFDLIFVMTKGGPNNATMVLNYLVYQQAFKFLNLGYGAAMAWILTGIVAVLTVLYLALLRKGGTTIG